MMARRVIPGLACWLLAAIHYFFLIPELERIPGDYADEVSFNATARFRESPSAEWTESALVARRVDQLLLSSAGHAIIQGDMHWSSTSGVVQYETSAIFGVDRDTRKNLPGYGDASRDGAFLFPLHTERKSYRYWDTQFIGARTAAFERTDLIKGIEVYVFRFSARGLDETAGYSHLPDVPERYRVLSDARGTLWVEPTSGTIVDYEEEGVSYFVEPQSRQRIADMYIWKDRFTEQARTSNLHKAKAERRFIGLLETWIPLALLVAGALAMLASLKRSRRAAPHDDARAALSPEVNA